ncbi:MAG: Ig-like domain-containing protein, partial [Candidatus Neomarinimicrobiota bacterium]
MLKLIIFPFLALTLWSAAEKDKVYYYLNENSFLSNQQIPVSETIGKAHIKIERDHLDRMVSKSMVNPRGVVEKIEKYFYQGLSQDIALKHYYNARNKLIKTTIFGEEPRSLSYIEWVFGVDTVKKWNDRFTTSTLNMMEKPENFRFFDVNAFEYGGMEFDYDSSGNKTREEWFRKPDNKSMHKYLYKLYPGLDYTNILEYDSNGVLINDLKLSKDGTEAILWVTNPLDSAHINNSGIIYRLEGDLDWGRFTWIPEFGEDSLILDLAALSRGDHRIAFDSDSNLSDSLKYNVIFSGFTKNGNQASERYLKQLTFDVSPPRMTLNIHKYLNSPEFEFITSEKLRQAFLVWNSSNSQSETSGDTVKFSAAELLKSGSGKFILHNQPDLRDSNFYSVKLIGFDQAGNQSITVKQDSILFDITGPSLVIQDLVSGDWINHQKFIFSTNETIKNWNLNLEWVGGTEDNAAPFAKNVADTVFNTKSDTSDLFADFQLNDGSIYAYKLQGIDLAGNSSLVSSIDSIHYDITAPEITMIYPFHSAIVKDVSVSYAVSELLLAGEFRWEQTAGPADTLAPHNVELINNELRAKEKIHINLENQPLLTDGASYTITVSGKDLAGNESEHVVVQNVLFDSSPPMFTNLGPASGSVVKNVDVSYKISENLKSGSIIWIPAGGEIDPLGVYLQNLDNDELAQGEHFNLEIINSPNLNDGTVYDIIFVGSDFAGNEADTVILENILYDFTAPEIVLDYPLPNTVSPTEKISYTLSENLKSGNFKWMWTGGNPDSNAPHILKLNIDELQGGEHLDFQFLEFPALVENAQYSLVFTGSDPAGNFVQGQDSIINIRYDFTPPVITWNYPRPNGAENDQKAGYKISEPLASGSITWKWTGGVKDTMIVRIAELSGDELLFDHPEDKLINNPALVDGAVYDLVFSGFDFAGNESETAEIHQVLYDFTPPEISISYPEPRSVSKSNLMTYTLSEDLYDGVLKWIWLGGSEDTLAPHVIYLNKNESKRGEHLELLLEDSPDLVDNSLYTLIVTGLDIAGNKLRRTIIPGLQYDYSAPEFTWTSPGDDTAQNHKRVQYGISEVLKSGYLTWVRVGGALDPLPEHRLKLISEELTGGEHPEKSLLTETNLVTGAVYNIKLSGTDLAGNTTDTLVAENVLYDTEAPQLSINYPASNIYTTSTNIIYSLDENIVEGEIIWENNSPDQNIPLISHKLELAASTQGQHSSDDYFIPSLIDGSVYTITLSAGDKAGNLSEPVKITNY